MGNGIRGDLLEFGTYRGYTARIMAQLIREFRGPTNPIAHLDCDLYASTDFFLTTLLERNLLQDGALLMFSDFNSNRASPRMGDRRALQDAFASQHRYEHQPFFPYGWNGQAFFVHERVEPRQ